MWLYNDTGRRLTGADRRYLRRLWRRRYRDRLKYLRYVLVYRDDGTGCARPGVPDVWCWYVDFASYHFLNVVVSNGFFQSSLDMEERFWVVGELPSYVETLPRVRV